MVKDNRNSIRKEVLHLIKFVKKTVAIPKPTHEGRYSRRLNRQHRVVYKVDEDEHVVEIYSARTHYESQ
ncbi:type II toxin-antitoxin system YoeB family toxin [Enterococcus faecium]|nr:type II toxin-antitoxin system YoeB family toxin [Enterococcus faecium]NTK60342.1 type II toxin-antitoxin system YoeB family toxin [Enterococcus faecium]NTR18617.1 type II toxin-antitoxin system YoeB family toxin [Enterococcus faecium]NTR23708.1 type II toxin-antitoxin system YoeB family toxin [Enterococcus faecium]